MNDVSLIPLDTAVVVKIEKSKDTTKSGIALPENMVERSQQLVTEGVLYSIGDFAFNELLLNNKKVPKIGDKVFFKKFSGILHDPKKNDDFIYRIINDIDIYAFEEVENDKRT